MKYLDMLNQLPGGVPARLAAAMLAVSGIAVSADQYVKFSTTVSPSQSQRDNYTQANRTCNSSSNAMYLNYFRVFNPETDRQGFVSDDTYLKSVLKRGDTTSHDVQTATLEAYGVRSRWDTSADINRLQTVLREGFPVVVNIKHRGEVSGCGKGALAGGHVILIRAIETINGKVVLRVTDPFGQICSNYTNTSLEYAMNLAEFKVRWQGGARYLK